MRFRSRMWKTTLLSVLLSIAVCTNAPAACESLFEYGIYDIEGKTNDIDRTLSFRQWVCQREFPAKADAAKFVVSTGIPPEGFPLRIGKDISEGDFKQSYAEFCADTDLDSPLNRDLSRNLKKINGKMFDHFNACLSSAGLHAWIKQTREEGRFYLNFRHRFPDSSPKPATVITITRFNITCDKLHLPFDLAGTEKSFFCTRIDLKSQSSLWILSSEPVAEGSNYWVGKTTYTPTADLPALP